MLQTGMAKKKTGRWTDKPENSRAVLREEGRALPQREIAVFRELRHKLSKTFTKCRPGLGIALALQEK